MKRNLAFALLAIIIILGAIFFFWRGRQLKHGNTKTVETVKVVPADFTVTFSIQGVLDAAAYTPVVNSGRDTQIVSVLPDGTAVKPGDIIMTLNDTDIKKEVDNLKKQVTEAEDSVRQQRDQASRQVENAKSALTKTEESLQLAETEGTAGLEKAKAEVAFLTQELVVAQGQLDRRRRLLAEHLLPVTEVEDAEDEVRDKQFSLEVAQRALDKSKQDTEDDIALKRMDLTVAQLELQNAESARLASIQTAQRQLLEKQSDLAAGQEQLDAMQVKATMAGMLLLEKIWDDGERALRVGDQVREGQRVAKIIDAREMLVRCSVAESDIDLIKREQEVAIRVPALGSLTLKGKVASVGSIASQGSPWQGGNPGQKVFSATVRITQENKRLRPGMGATVDVVMERVKTGLAVPVEALLTKAGKTGVYVKSGSGYAWVPVKVSKRNNTLAAVSGDLREGAQVALPRPPDELINATTGSKRK